MATRPAFAATPLIGFGAVSTANTNRDGTGTIVDVVTAGASGAKIEQLVLKATGDPADSVVTIFLDTGGGYKLYDEVDLGDPAAASTTVAGARFTKAYDDLVLGAGHKLGAAITVALTSGVINVWAHGGHY